MATALAIDHIVLVARDVEVTLAWYQQHLGLSGLKVDKWRRGEVPFPSLRVNGHTIIDVLHGDPDGGGHVAHLCFAVSPDDLAALKADPTLEIEDEGIRFGARGNGPSIYVRDPDGLTVELKAYEAP